MRWVRLYVHVVMVGGTLMCMSHCVVAVLVLVFVHIYEGACSQAHVRQYLHMFLLPTPPPPPRGPPSISVHRYPVRRKPSCIWTPDCGLLPFMEQSRPSSAQGVPCRRPLHRFAAVPDSGVADGCRVDAGPLKLENITRLTDSLNYSCSFILVRHCLGQG